MAHLAQGDSFPDNPFFHAPPQFQYLNLTLLFSNQDNFISMLIIFNGWSEQFFPSLYYTHKEIRYSNNDVES